MCLPRARKSTSRYHQLPSSDSLPASAYPRVVAMGAPPSSSHPPMSANNNSTMSPTPFAGPPSTSFLSAQHERLILELLPFKDSAKFQEWLNSDWVRGSWLEFHADFLGKTARTGPSSAAAPEPDKGRAAQAAKDAINSRSQKYLVYHPNKTGWTAEDHHVRFIVTVIQDNMLRSLWSESEWKKKAIDIAKAVFEVLCFLKATFYVVDQHPPSYSQ
ncbi:hypothetical protein JDV02_000405 [Purpureocillium takamizusanense]|uniref:Uncharacterized protein n=1 Tax=Purpureocillium takamizusanense TaxID=2060973 RepID=A0A9Q8V5H2_9HYPO|nr:uncharacterized protein JDV02_000405 [Purpureocillium takamizusanense]UNI13683.1 hypothetical protein JDV02_000405 [Purpureocillium takamizusanense]